MFRLRGKCLGQVDVWVKGQVSGCTTGRRAFERRGGRVAIYLGRERGVCAGVGGGREE